MHNDKNTNTLRCGDRRAETRREANRRRKSHECKNLVLTYAKVTAISEDDIFPLKSRKFQDSQLGLSEVIIHDSEPFACRPSTRRMPPSNNLTLTYDVSTVAKRVFTIGSRAWLARLSINFAVTSAFFSPRAMHFLYCGLCNLFKFLALLHPSSCTSISPFCNSFLERGENLIIQWQRLCAFELPTYRLLWDESLPAGP